MSTRLDMIRQLSALEAHRREVSDGRKRLQAEVMSRADALGPAIEAVAEHPDLEFAGVLGHRYHLTLLSEHKGYLDVAQRG